MNDKYPRGLQIQQQQTIIFVFVFVISLNFDLIETIFYMDTSIIRDQPVSCKIRACPQCDYLVIDRDWNDCVICYCSAIPDHLLEWAVPHSSPVFRPPLIYFIPDEFEYVHLDTSAKPYSRDRPKILKPHRITPSKTKTSTIGQLTSTKFNRRIGTTNSYRTLFSRIYYVAGEGVESWRTSLNSSSSTTTTTDLREDDNSKTASRNGTISTFGNYSTSAVIPTYGSSEPGIVADPWWRERFMEWVGGYLMPVLQNFGNETTETDVPAVNHTDQMTGAADEGSIFPYFTPDVRNYYAKEGDVLNVTCNPPPFHTKRTFTLSVHVEGLRSTSHSIRGGLVRIWGMVAPERGEIRCRYAGSTVSSLIRMRLYVLPFPKIAFEDTNLGPLVGNVLFIDIGQSLNVTCRLQSNPSSFDVYWESRSIWYTGNLLIITNASCRHVGLHYCHVYNRIVLEGDKFKYSVRSLVIDIEFCHAKKIEALSLRQQARNIALFPYMVAILVFVGALGISVLACILFWRDPIPTADPDQGSRTISWIGGGGGGSKNGGDGSKYIFSSGNYQTTTDAYAGTYQNDPPYVYLYDGGGGVSLGTKDTSFSETPTNMGSGRKERDSTSKTHLGTNKNSKNQLTRPLSDTLKSVLPNDLLLTKTTTFVSMYPDKRSALSLDLKPSTSSTKSRSDSGNANDSNKWRGAVNNTTPYELISPNPTVHHPEGVARNPKKRSSPQPFLFTPMRYVSGLDDFSEHGSWDYSDVNQQSTSHLIDVQSGGETGTGEIALDPRALGPTGVTFGTPVPGWSQKPVSTMSPNIALPYYNLFYSGPTAGIKPGYSDTSSLGVLYKTKAVDTARAPSFVPYNNYAKMCTPKEKKQPCPCLDNRVVSHKINIESQNVNNNIKLHYSPSTTANNNLTDFQSKMPPTTEPSENRVPLCHGVRSSIPSLASTLFKGAANQLTTANRLPATAKKWHVVGPVHKPRLFNIPTHRVVNVWKDEKSVIRTSTPLLRESVPVKLAPEIGYVESTKRPNNFDSDEPPSILYKTADTHFSDGRYSPYSESSEKGSGDSYITEDFFIPPAYPNIIYQPIRNCQNVETSTTTLVNDDVRQSLASAIAVAFHHKMKARREHHEI